MDYSTLFAMKEREYGLPPGYLTRTAQIESGMNPEAKNPDSSAGGLFQFIDSTADAYGLGNRFDPIQSTDAAARLARDNAAYLAKKLGRQLTAAELYLAHQQGMGGAAALLANPDAMAADVVGSAAAGLNAGEGMTARDFAAQWLGKFDGQGPGPAGGPPPDETAMTSVYSAFLNGKMTPEEKKEYERDALSGNVWTPPGSVFEAYLSKANRPRAQLQTADLRGIIK